MNANDVIVLARAGFNSGQIAALLSVVNSPAPAPAPAPAAPAPAAPAPAAPAPAAPAPAAPAPAAPTAIPADPNAAWTQLLTALQMGNIANAAQPATRTPENILAEIINPPAPTEVK